jgi:hypothetical protein
MWCRGAELLVERWWRGGADASAEVVVQMQCRGWGAVDWGAEVV